MPSSFRLSAVLLAGLMLTSCDRAVSPGGSLNAEWSRYESRLRPSLGSMPAQRLVGAVAVTPVGDGRRVAVHFATGGNELWRTSDRQFFLQLEGRPVTDGLIAAKATLLHSHELLVIDAPEEKRRLVFALTEEAGSSGPAQTFVQGQAEYFRAWGYARRVKAEPFAISAVTADVASRDFPTCSSSTVVGTSLNEAPPVCTSGGMGAESCATSCLNEPGGGQCTVSCRKGYACCNKYKCTCTCVGGGNES